MTVRIPNDELHERVAKLPVWAREYIARLERQRADAEDKHRELFDSQNVSTVTYGDQYHNPRYLPDGRRDPVRYTLPDSRDRQDWIEMLPGGSDRVGYYGDPDFILRGSDGFVILPQSSNSVGIRLLRRP